MEKKVYNLEDVTTTPLFNLGIDFLNRLRKELDFYYHVRGIEHKHDEILYTARVWRKNGRE